MKTFKHNYDTSTGVERIAGFTECLDGLLGAINELTQNNPAKRYIDAVKLLDRITGTNNELGEILNQIRGELTIESFTTRN